MNAVLMCDGQRFAVQEHPAGGLVAVAEGMDVQCRAMSLTALWQCVSDTMTALDVPLVTDIRLPLDGHTLHAGGTR